MNCIPTLKIRFLELSAKHDAEHQRMIRLGEARFGQCHLSAADYQEMTTLGAMLERQTEIRLGSPRLRVPLKRKLRRAGVNLSEFPGDVPLTGLEELAEAG